MGYELGTAVGGNVFRHTMFREYMKDEEGCKVFRSAVDGSQDEYALLGEPIDDY